MRSRKTVSLLVLSSFLIFEWSCASIGGAGGKSARFEDAVEKDISQVDQTNLKTKVFRVVKKDGKRILFPENAPGRFDPDAEAVVGVALQQFVFVKNEVLIAREGKKEIVRSVTTRDGRFYEVLSSLDEGDNIRVNAYAPISIPFSDIQQVSVLKPARRGGVFVTIVAVVGGAAVGYVLFKGMLSGFGNIFGKAIPDWE